jgi:hypothetical protein
MIRKMLEVEDYSSILGCQPHHKHMLCDAFDARLNRQSSAEILRRLCLINSVTRMSTWTNLGLKR